MEGQIKLLEVWFCSVFQIVKSRIDVLIKVAIIIKSWYCRWLSLKWMVKVAKVFIASVIIYRLNVVPCPDLWSCKLERQTFHFQWSSLIPLVTRSICSQKPLNSGLGIPWLLMCKRAEVVTTLGSERAWSSLAKQVFPNFTSFGWWENWVQQQ